MPEQVAQEGVLPPSQVQLLPPNPAPPNRVLPPFPNCTVPANNISHHEDLEEESSYHHPTKNQQQTRERASRKEPTSMRTKRDFFDSKDNSPLASNLISTPLPNFKVPFLEHYDGSRDPDDHLQNYNNAVRLREPLNHLCARRSQQPNEKQ